MAEMKRDGNAADRTMNDPAARDRSWRSPAVRALLASGPPRVLPTVGSGLNGRLTARDVRNATPARQRPVAPELGSARGTLGCAWDVLELPDDARAHELSLLDVRAALDDAAVSLGWDPLLVELSRHDDERPIAAIVPPAHEYIASLSVGRVNIEPAAVIDSLGLPALHFCARRHVSLCWVVEERRDGIALLRSVLRELSAQ